MSSEAQSRARRHYRARLVARGFSRFEILAPDADRELIRSLALRLAEGGPGAEQTRAAMRRVVAGAPAEPGGILAALRWSPLVGAGLDLSRLREEGRDTEL